MKKIMMSILISIFLMLGTNLNVYADGGEPPTPGPGECFAGPRIIGVLTLSDNGDYTISGGVRGFCKLEFVKKNICNMDIYMDFADITKDHIIGLRFPGYGPEDCLSLCGGEDLIIWDIKKFKNTGSKIFAEIVFKYVLYGEDACPP